MEATEDSMKQVRMFRNFLTTKNEAMYKSIMGDFNLYLSLNNRETATMRRLLAMTFGVSANPSDPFDHSNAYISFDFKKSYSQYG